MHDLFNTAKLLGHVTLTWEVVILTNNQEFLQIAYCILLLIALAFYKPAYFTKKHAAKNVKSSRIGGPTHENFERSSKKYCIVCKLSRMLCMQRVWFTQICAQYIKFRSHVTLSRVLFISRNLYKNFAWYKLRNYKKNIEIQ